MVPRDRIKGTPGLILQTSKSVLFVIPWSRYWVIGTTDTPWHEELMNPVATAADIDYVIAEANKVLVHPIGHADIVGTWAGLGAKTEPASYERIATALGIAPHDGLFLSDASGELDAARAAGWQTMQLVRAGTAPALDHARVGSFAEIALE